MSEYCAVSLRLVAKAGTDPADITAFVGCEPTEIEPGPNDSRRWVFAVEGPSPVNAGRVANDLARDLLARVGAAGQTREMWTRMRHTHETVVRFEFGFRQLVNFSYELDPDIVHRLADLDALIAFLHCEEPHDGSLVAPFGRNATPGEKAKVSLRISGEDLDPDAVTHGLDVQPSSTARKGEPVRPRSERIHAKSFWFLDGASSSIDTLHEPVARLFERLPTESDAWIRLSRDHAVHVMHAFTVDRLTGCVFFGPTMMRRLADCGVGLDLAFYDFL